MKFNCGHWPDKRKKLEDWHEFFAIFPRKVAPYDCRWLETVERKGVLNVSYDRRYWSWEYRQC